MSLLINELFYSIQGETTTAGFPSIFVRLTGCNLNCSWCDTPQARTEGAPMEVPAIIDRIETHPSAHHVTITGGEPLLQHDTIHLIREILAKGRRVQIETNGSILCKDVPEQARKIVDVKTPSSGEADSFEMRNLKYMSGRDELKFVIATAGDYDFSKEFFNKYCSGKGFIVNFSPVSNALSYKELADRIVVDNLPVRLNMQLHKIIWGDDAKGR